jgi:hypothetical protein
MHPGNQSVGHLCNLVALSSYLSLAISGLHFANVSTAVELKGRSYLDVLKMWIP